MIAQIFETTNKETDRLINIEEEVILRDNLHIAYRQKPQNNFATKT